MTLNLGVCACASGTILDGEGHCVEKTQEQKTSSHSSDYTNFIVNPATGKNGTVVNITIPSTAANTTGDLSPISQTNFTNTSSNTQTVIT